MRYLCPCLPLTAEYPKKALNPSAQLLHIKSIERSLAAFENVVSEHVTSQETEHSSTTLTNAPSLDMMALTLEEKIYDHTNKTSTHLEIDDAVTFFRMGNSQTIRFLGNTSAIAPGILRKSMRTLNSITHFTDIPSRAVPPEHEFTKLCSPELHEYLAGIYFRAIHPFYPMLDQGLYFKNLKLENPPTDFTILMYAVSAIVTQIIGSIPEWDITHAFVMSLSLIRRIRTLIPVITDECSLFSIQACLLVSICGSASIETINPMLYVCKNHKYYIDF